MFGCFWRGGGYPYFGHSVLETMGYQVDLVTGKLKKLDMLMVLGD